MSLVKDPTNIRLGIAGKVDENDHPYSWSAILNGYEPQPMREFAHPMISDYLAAQLPENLGVPGVSVTHVWCEAPLDARRIAQASRIDKIVPRCEDLIGQVDAVLIPTDRGEEHVRRARLFVEADIPVFIDKPLCDNLTDLQIFHDWTMRGCPIMSCSAMRYSREFDAMRRQLSEIGELRMLSITLAKSWRRYGIHALEAVYPFLAPGGWISATNTGREDAAIVHLKQDSAKDYFTAGGSLGSFFGIILVGLSIAATLFSGISFIAQPALAYSTGIIFLVWSAFVCMPISYVILRYWFLPRYLNAGCVYPYDILEKRFGFQTRLIASSLFIFMRIGWMAAMIYAPSIAILSMGRLNDAWFWPVVLVTGLSSTIYSAFSGIRGVIVTDAMQMVVIIIGIAATASFAIYHLPVPFDVALADLQAAGKLRVFDFSLNPTRSMTFFTIVIGVTVANLANYLGDQMSLQRYLATGSVKGSFLPRPRRW